MTYINTDYIQSVKDIHKHKTTKHLIKQLITIYNQDSSTSEFEELQQLLFVNEDEYPLKDKHLAQLLDDTIDDSINELEEYELLTFLALYPDPRYLIQLNKNKFTPEFKDYWYQIRHANYDYIISVLTAMQQRIDIMSRDLKKLPKNSPEYVRQNLHIKHSKNILSDVRKTFKLLETGEE